jgi:hypothetical protein
MNAAATMKTLNLLAFDECKFAMGETLISSETIDRCVTLFCARPAMPDKAYCPEHEGLCHGPSVSRHDRQNDRDYAEIDNVALNPLY